MHTNFPILNQMIEDQRHILDANYTKVNIDDIMDSLDIQWSGKRSLKATLKKYPKLFGGCLDKLKMEPVSITMKEGS